MEANSLATDWHARLGLSQLAAYIRYQFIRLNEHEHDWDAPAHNRRRPMWDGGKDSYGVKHTAVWTRVAKLVRDNRADPGLWVHAHFSPISMLKSGIQLSGMPDMRPTRLCSGQSVGIYHEYCEKLPQILRNNFELAGGTIARRYKATDTFGLSEDDHVFYVICDEAYVSASPFFRHAFAAQLGCWRGVERYLWLAALDYEAQQRLYDAAVEPWCVTETLKAAAHDIRHHWETFA